MAQQPPTTSQDDTSAPTYSNGPASRPLGASLPKKLCVLCDGTWQNSDGKSGTPTNITRLGRAVSSLDKGGHQQIVYYQAGVGTGLGLFNHIWGGATGYGLAEHIQEAYAFLVSNYSEHEPPALPTQKDSIFLIGFSRGAYTARSIGGLLGAVGLLKRNAMPYFLDIFSDWEHAGKRGYEPKFFKSYNAEHEKEDDLLPPKLKFSHPPKMSEIDEYMKAYRQILYDAKLSQQVTVQAIGVFDTVGSLGIPVMPALQRLFRFLPATIVAYTWFDTRIGEHVKRGYQALALDEKRAPYHPAVWERQTEQDGYIKQVWFPGAHSNIGGGYTETGISDLTIAWMMDHLSGQREVLPPGKELEPLDWIKFDDDSIDEFFEKRLARHNRQHEKGLKPLLMRKWAHGFVYNSFTFPQSLLGQRVRTPGQYHRANFITGRDLPQSLQNTNELIHESVRIRWRQEGRAPEPNWDNTFPHTLNVWPWFEWAWYSATGKLASRFGRRAWPAYDPTAKKRPLHEWVPVHEKLKGGTPQNGDEINGAPDSPTDAAVYWQWTGTGHVDHPILTEDDLGRYERRLKELERKGGEPVPDELSLISRTFARWQQRPRHAKTL